MQYIKIDSDTYIEYNEVTRESKTYIKSELEAEIAGLSSTINNVPSDEELMAWGKENHPKYVEVVQLTQDKEKLESVLQNLT